MSSIDVILLSVLLVILFCLWKFRKRIGRVNTLFTGFVILGLFSIPLFVDPTGDFLLGVPTLALAATTVVGAAGWFFYAPVILRNHPVILTFLNALIAAVPVAFYAFRENTTWQLVAVLLFPLAGAVPVRMALLGLPAVGGRTFKKVTRSMIPAAICLLAMLTAVVVGPVLGHAIRHSYVRLNQSELASVARATVAGERGRWGGGSVRAQFGGALFHWGYGWPPHRTFLMWHPDPSPRNLEEAEKGSWRLEPLRSLGGHPLPNWLVITLPPRDPM